MTVGGSRGFFAALHKKPERHNLLSMLFCRDSSPHRYLDYPVPSR